MAMKLAEIQLRMCPLNLKCHRCPFKVKDECTISKGYNLQRSCQHVNNMQNTKRQWTLAAQIENE